MGSLLLFTHLLVMCPRCVDEQIEFEFTDMAVEAMDNSGAYPVRTVSDTLYRQAVAFVVEVFDTTRHYGDWWAGQWHWIRPAQAISIDCEPIFTAGSLVSAMEIITLYDLSSDAGSGAEVSRNFLASFGFYQPENLYLSIEELFEQKRGRYSFPFPKDEWYVFYRGPVEADSIRFLFRVFLDDGRQLEANSPTIYIKDHALP